MHLLTKQALKNLKNDNISITPEQAIELNEYAEQTTHVSDQRMYNSSGKFIGNTEIFPLSLGAKVWLKEEAFEWFKYDETLYGISLIYAMANARYPSKFNFKNAKQCRKALIKFAKAVNATQEELMSIANSTQTDDYENDKILYDLYEQILKHPDHLNIVSLVKYCENEGIVEQDKGITPIIAWLISNLGQSVEYWLWEHDWDSINDLIMVTQEQMSGDKIIDPNDPSIFAMKKFQNLLLRIRSVKHE